MTTKWHHPRTEECPIPWALPGEFTVLVKCDSFLYPKIHDQLYDIHHMSVDWTQVIEFQLLKGWELWLPCFSTKPEGLVEVGLRCGNRVIYATDKLDWTHNLGGSDILAYRPAVQEKVKELMQKRQGIFDKEVKAKQKYKGSLTERCLEESTVKPIPYHVEKAKQKYVEDSIKDALYGFTNWDIKRAASLVAQARFRSSLRGKEALAQIGKTDKPTPPLGEDTMLRIFNDALDLFEAELKRKRNGS